MKVFRCDNCGKYLGEMTKGKINKTAKIYCEDCDIAHRFTPIDSNVGLEQLKNIFGFTDFDNYKEGETDE